MATTWQASHHLDRFESAVVLRVGRAHRSLEPGFQDEDFSIGLRSGEPVPRSRYLTRDAHHLMGTKRDQMRLMRYQLDRFR